MCGICGVIHFDGQRVDERALRAMNARLRHRGPDGEGAFIAGGVGLAMRRLKIIDIAGSDQPLHNEDGEIQLVFNGEIYNYRELRQRLAARGHCFHTDGDGETIAHLYEDHGAAAVGELRGMFALALWDGRKKTLLLARDRLGQKPLYYYYNRRSCVFASEIKALLAHPAVPRVSRFSPDAPAALRDYLSFGYIPAPDTAFAGIKMLPPGATLEIGLADDAQSRRYWTPPLQAPPTANAQAADHKEALRAQLDEAVRLRLVSDVPLGAFLSGGLDSSLIVALMRRHSNAEIKTFSIGFAGDASFDETPYAEAVARHLGAQHQSFRVEPMSLDLLLQLVWHHDQPFADSSAIPTFLVSQMTREHVTVALTGDGGDELFAGYERFYAAQLLGRLSFVPRPVMRGLSQLLGRLPEGTAYYDRVRRARRFSRAAGLPLRDAYFDMVRVFSTGLLEESLPGTSASAPSLAAWINPRQPHPVAALLEANLTSYLPDDLLIKADRCSMAASLEARAPFLDHQLLEYAAGIPFNLKLRGGQTKHILKEVARDLLPAAIIDRKKHGFGIPLGAWLRRDMRLVRDMLLSQRARQRGLLKMSAVEHLIIQHENRRRDNSRQLWALLTLEEWHRQFVDSAPASTSP
ncbi:MAG: asparagine synthase (glutamine-hydrolyzing) [Chloroflexi bacterium]|nr:asparagine synthase (glutamine-hydrolyzing) [Chloroflexota bacterium]MCY4247072.1 asparagine synthase (glutamine-hydrolyzing) [Chloroflexota bacterium]